MGVVRIKRIVAIAAALVAAALSEEAGSAAAASARGVASRCDGAPARLGDNMPFNTTLLSSRVTR